MECRTSGLTDHEWCLQHDIKIGTFYNWVKRLRKPGCSELPDSAGHHNSPRRQFLMADETRIQVLHEKERKAETDSFMWLFRSGEDGLLSGI